MRNEELLSMFPFLSNHDLSSVFSNMEKKVYDENKGIGVSERRSIEEY